MQQSTRTAATRHRPNDRGLVHVSQPVAEVMRWLGDLRADAEAGARRHGPLRGPVRPPQRAWSRTLDAIAGERETVA